ncbi:hypothetical protein CR513_51079 [Mucuna pruriens]|uniref:Uncharacterized protein n=1 Tax=Mucuna pruriens TaxID=157652 RepID=A0A371EUM0_MUCPR|nr:hypothetical protein CR513_51079 [Mucuna pruriens]
MNALRHRLLHTLRGDVPTETLKRKALELEKKRKMRRSKSKDQFIVPVPESLSYLDTATMPMIVAAVGIALFAKLLMMYDESRSQELLERKIKNAPEGQGSVRMLNREEWEKVREISPRTPFESKFARSNSRIRTGEPLRLEDVKDWTTDVLMDALHRVDEYGCNCKDAEKYSRLGEMYQQMQNKAILLMNLLCCLLLQGTRIKTTSNKRVTHAHTRVEPKV